MHPGTRQAQLTWSPWLPRGPGPTWQTGVRVSPPESATAFTPHPIVVQGSLASASAKLDVDVNGHRRCPPCSAPSPALTSPTSPGGQGSPLGPERAVGWGWSRWCWWGRWFASRHGPGSRTRQAGPEASLGQPALSDSTERGSRGGPKGCSDRAGSDHRFAAGPRGPSLVGA